MVNVYTAEPAPSLDATVTGIVDKSGGASPMETDPFAIDNGWTVNWDSGDPHHVEVDVSVTLC